jgi:hypothetical protein
MLFLFVIPVGVVGITLPHDRAKDMAYPRRNAFSLAHSAGGAGNSRLPGEAARADVTCRRQKTLPGHGTDLWVLGVQIPVSPPSAVVSISGHDHDHAAQNALSRMPIR